jgi:hypothetical protein
VRAGCKAKVRREAKLSAGNAKPFFLSLSVFLMECLNFFESTVAKLLKNRIYSSLFYTSSVLAGEG